MASVLRSIVRIAWRVIALVAALAAPLAEVSWMVHLELDPELAFILNDDKETTETSPMFVYANMLILPPEEIELYTRRPELLPPERIDVETEDDWIWRNIFSVRPEFLPERGPPLLVGHPAGGSRLSRLYEVDGLILEAGCGMPHFAFIRVLNAPDAGSQLDQAQAIADRLFREDAHLKLKVTYSVADWMYGGAVNDLPRPNHLFNWRRTMRWASNGRIVGFYGVHAPYGNMYFQYYSWKWSALHIEPTEPVVEPSHDRYR